MAGLIDFKGLEILDVTPIGEGGRAINDNFIKIANDLDDLSTNAGDMFKVVYDSDDDGLVNGAETLSDGVNTTTAATLTTHLNNLSIHRVLDDSLTTSANLWSASKIQTEIGASGGGDMLKSVYDIDDDGRVDFAETLSDGTNTSTAAQVRTHIDDATLHRTINDAGSGATDLLSAQEIDSRISASSGAVVVTQSGDAIITSDGTGITFSKAAGVGTVTVPSATNLHYVRIIGESADLDGGSNFTVRLTFTGLEFNTTETDTLYPNVSLIERGAEGVIPTSPDPGTPFTYKLDASGGVAAKVTERTAGTGTLDIRFEGLLGFSKWVIILSF